MRLLSMVLALLSGVLFLAQDLAAQRSSSNSLKIAMQYRGSGSHLGVRLTDLDSDRAKVLHLGEARGAEVVSVEENGPAEQAGIRAVEQRLHTQRGPPLCRAHHRAGRP